MVKNVRKFNILSFYSLSPAAADIVSCTAVGKQTSTLVTITLELPLELELEPPSEPTFLINLTGAFAACNLPDRAEAEQRNSTSHKTYEGTCIFHEVLAFVPITIISPRAPASALIPGLPRFLARSARALATLELTMTCSNLDTVSSAYLFAMQVCNAVTCCAASSHLSHPPRPADVCRCIPFVFPFRFCHSPAVFTNCFH